MSKGKFLFLRHERPKTLRAFSRFLLLIPFLCSRPPPHVAGLLEERQQQQQLALRALVGSGRKQLEKKRLTSFFSLSEKKNRPSLLSPLLVSRLLLFQNQPTRDAPRPSHGNLCCGAARRSCPARGGGEASPFRNGYPSGGTGLAASAAARSFDLDPDSSFRLRRRPGGHRGHRVQGRGLRGRGRRGGAGGRPGRGGAQGKRRREEEKKKHERERRNRSRNLFFSSFFSLPRPPQKPNQQTIPCSFLYDGPGSALYDAITDLEAYYPYRAETRLLDSQSDAIAAAIPPNAVLVELGCGSATKTPRLLSAVARKNKNKNEKSNESGEGSASSPAVRYAGIDVSADFLANARLNVTASGDVADADVETFCLRYLEGAAAARAAHRGEDLCFLWLGSSVGNLDAGSAAAFVRELFEAASAESAESATAESADSEGNVVEGGKEGGKGKGKTQLLLCTDLWKDEARLRAAYDDDRGVTAAFMRNGLRHALACVEVLEEEDGSKSDAATSTSTATAAAATTAKTTTALRVAAAAGAAPAAWRYEVDVNPSDEQVEMYLVCPSAFELRIVSKKEKKEESKEDKESGGDGDGGGDSSAAGPVSVVRFAKGERVLMEVSRKYTLARVEALAASSGVRLAGRWVTEDYGIQLLE